MRFLKKEAKGGSKGGLVTSIPMTGETLTKILRGMYARDPKKAVVEAKKELVDHQGFEDFKTKKGEKELLDVLKGKKRFVGETTHPEGLSTEDEKAPEDDE